MIETAAIRELLASFGNEPTTADAVCATLRHCIVEGTLQPGHRLLSDDLASRMGVSRTPVREALRKLEAEGYVAASGKGLVVREYSEKDLEEVFFIRELLEGAAARLAAENASSTELVRMEELLEDMEIANQRGNADAFRLLTGEFHSLVHQASRNDRLAAMLRDLQDNVRRFSSSTLFAAGRTAEALVEHRDLFEAVKNRDGNKADDLARSHRRKTLAMRRQMVRSQARGEMAGDASHPNAGKNTAWPV